MTYKLNRDYQGYKKGETLTNKFEDLDGLHPDEIKLLLDAGYLTPILDLPEDVKEDIKLLVNSFIPHGLPDNFSVALERLRTLIGE